MERETLTLTVNGVEREIRVGPRTTLLEVLREELGLTGTKNGCGQGHCGTCTVLVDGQAVRSCVYLARRAAGRQVLTIEGLPFRAGGKRGRASTLSSRPLSSREPCNAVSAPRG